MANRPPSGPSRGADPSRILFDFDEHGNALPLDPDIFTKKFDVQIISDTGLELAGLTDWMRPSQSLYKSVGAADIMKDVEVWSTTWEPKAKVSNQTVLSMTVDVQLDMKRCKPKDFDKYNKMIGQHLMSSVLEKTADELRRLSGACACVLCLCILCMCMGMA